jgi:TolA-binding protein
MKPVSLPLLLLGLAATVAQAAPKNAPTIKDLENRAVEVKKDGPSNANAEKTMESYRRFLDLNAGDAQLRAEALRRLGDLNLESSESERIEKELVSNEGLRATEAITLYGALLKAYPKYERNDAVLYQLARAYELNVQPEKALATLDQLVATHPASRYIDEAQFRRGELLFSAANYAGAQKAYESVIKVGRVSQFYRQSLYKHGWALFKQGDNETSLNSFAGVLDSVLVSSRNPRKVVEIDTLSRPDRELVEDSFRVMSITFSYGEGPKTIDEFMKSRQGKPYAYLLYARLGDLYMEKQRYTDAADTYRSFATRQPNHDKAPLLQMQAIEAYKAGGFPELVLEGKKEFVENYGLKGAFWKGRDPKKLTAVTAQLKTNLKDVAQYYHAQAQRTKSTADYQEAARWYRDYLTSFPDDPESANTNYLLADTLFESKQYLDAAQEYERTAYTYGPGEKAMAAGYAAIVAYGKQEESASAEQKLAIHAQSLESSLKFASTYPQHPEVPQVLTRAATDLYAAKDLGRAASVAQTLLARQPPVDVTKQRVAWTVIANSSFDQQQYGPAEAAYAKAQALMPANDPERGAIVERLAASIYKQGEAKNAAGDGAGAVEDFLRVSTLAPGSKIRSNADFDAAALLISQKQWERAIGVLEGFRRNFPQSPLQADVTRKLAVAYSEGGHPGQAAAEFEQIAASPKETPEVQREAILQAAELYGKGGNAAKARGMLENFVKRFPMPLDPAMEARDKLAGMAQKSGDLNARNAWLREIIAADRNAGPQRTDRSRSLAAHATLTFATPLQEEFNRIRLVAPLKKSLAEKRKAMEAALKGYTQAADYQVADVTTAATFHSAELYRQLGKDLMASERPKKLSKDELEQYEVLLEEQAFPFEEKSIKLHEVNAARTQQGIYDEWVQKSFDALAKLNPGRYAKTEVSENVVEAIR